MDSRIVRIGSSLGLIIPKTFATQCGLSIGTPLSIYVKKDGILVSKRESPRDGWSNAFSKYASSAQEEEMLPAFLDSEIDEL